MSATSKLRQIRKTARRTAEKIGDSEIMDRVTDAGEFLADKAGDLKDAAMDVKEDIDEKLTELDRMLEQAVTDYNDAYTLMNDKGTRLYIERCRAVDVIDNIENLVNSIANHPKEFDADFESIEISRKKFTDNCEFAEREIQAAREAAGGAGAGLAAGASVAFMAPTAAMAIFWRPCSVPTWAAPPPPVLSPAGTPTPTVRAPRATASAPPTSRDCSPPSPAAACPQTAAGWTQS